MPVRPSPGAATLARGEAQDRRSSAPVASGLEDPEGVRREAAALWAMADRESVVPGVAARARVAKVAPVAKPAPVAAAARAWTAVDPGAPSARARPIAHCIRIAVHAKRLRQ